MGAGTFYSGVGVGVGVNAGIQSKNDLKYISAGCVSYSSIYGGTCGVGVGWVKTDIFDFQTPKHGVSLYIGVVGSEFDNLAHEAVYGASLGYHYFLRGIGYHYFLRGIGNPGFNFGFTLVAGNEKDGVGGIFQAGYQF
ncbi:MAG: hypothetical protein MJK15_22815 [Colwellia sp.]|nr:hypothetical protein [Colwellia sp.]